MSDDTNDDAVTDLNEALAKATKRVEEIDEAVARLTAERKAITAALGRTRKPRSDKGRPRRRTESGGAP